MAYGVREHGMGGAMVGMSRHGGVLPDRRHVLRVQRLHAGIGAAVGPVQYKGHLLLDPRLDRAGRGRPDPPAGRAARRDAGHAQPAALSAPPTPTRPRRRSGSPSTTTARQPSSCPARPYRCSRARPNEPSSCSWAPTRSPGTSRAPTSCSSAPGPRCGFVSTPPSCSKPTGYRVRVVSMPSWELFEEQDEDYQDEVLGAGAPVLAVEAAASFGWSLLGGRHRFPRPLRRLRPRR